MDGTTDNISPTRFQILYSFYIFETTAALYVNGLQGFYPIYQSGIIISKQYKVIVETTEIQGQGPTVALEMLQTFKYFLSIFKISSQI